MARFWRNRGGRVLPLSDAVNDEGQGGTVAAGLGVAERLGLPVPPTWVISAEVFRRIVRSDLPPGHDIATLMRIIERPKGRERAARARERLLGLELDPDLRDDLERLFEAFRKLGVQAIALRSSPTIPSASAARAAGLVRVRLGMETLEELEHAVRALWASTISEVTLGQLKAWRIRDFSVAIIVQPFVGAELSGSVFSDERTFFPDRVTRPGGEHGPVRVAMAGHVVDGDVTGLRRLPAEVVRFESGGRVIERGRGAGSLRHRDPAAPAAFDRQVMSDTVIDKLSELCAALEPEGPHEIGFRAGREGQVTVVDVWPAGGAGFPRGGDATTLWSRWGPSDAVPEVLTPLSRDMARRLAETAVTAAVERAGGRAKRVDEWVVPVRARCYLNVTALLDEAGHRFDGGPRPLVELAGGQWDGERLSSAVQPGSLARLGLRARRLAADRNRLAETVERFNRDAEQQRRWLAEMDLAILPDDSLKTTLREGVDFFRRATGLMFECAAAMRSAHDALGAVLARSGIEEAGRLATRITAGVSDLETTKLAVAFGHVLAIAQKEARVSAGLSQGLYRKVGDLPAGPTRRALRQILAAFGDRGVSELELASPRFRESSRTLIAMLRIGMDAPPIDSDEILSNVRAAVDRDLAWLEARLPFVQTRIVRDLVALGRALIGLRAVMRVRVAHALGMMRTIALDIDRRLSRLDPEMPRGAALYCTLGELVTAVGSYRADLAPVVALRRAEHADLLDGPAPALTFRGAPVFIPQLPSRLDELSGTAIGGGVVESRVCRVGERLAGLERFRPGDVLLAKSPDLGMAPLFLLSGAVVTERGNALSDGALVARELGVPCVVGLRGAWTWLADGEPVRVNAREGLVERLDS